MRGPPLVCPEWEGSVDERCRLAGGGLSRWTISPQLGRRGRGEKRAKIYIEAVLMGKIWEGGIEDGPMGKGEKKIHNTLVTCGAGGLEIV